MANNIGVAGSVYSGNPTALCYENTSNITLSGAISGLNVGGLTDSTTPALVTGCTVWLGAQTGGIGNGFYKLTISGASYTLDFANLDLSSSSTLKGLYCILVLSGSNAGEYNWNITGSGIVNITSQTSTQSVISYTASQNLLRGDRVKLSGANIANILNYSTTGNNIIGQASIRAVTSDASFAATPPLSWANFPLVTIGNNSLFLNVVSKTGSTPYIYLKSLNVTTDLMTEAANYVSPSIAASSIIYKATYFTLNGLHYFLVVYGAQAATALNNLIIQFDPITVSILGEITLVPTSGSSIASPIYSADNVLISTTGTTIARFTTMIAESTVLNSFAANTLLVTFTGVLTATATNVITSIVAAGVVSTDTTAIDRGQGIRCMLSGVNKVFVAFSTSAGSVIGYNINYTAVAPVLFGAGTSLIAVGTITFCTALETCSTTGYIVCLFTVNVSGVTSTYNRYTTGMFMGLVNVTGILSPVLVFGLVSTPIAGTSLSLANVNGRMLHTSLIRYSSNLSNFDTFAVMYSDSSTSGSTANLFYSTFTINLSPAPVFGAYKDFIIFAANSILNANSSINYKVNKYFTVLSNGRILVTYCSTTNGNNIYTRILQSGTQTLDIANCIGVCQANTLSGAQAPVKLLGESSLMPISMGNLTAGANYYIQALGDISTNPTTSFLGRALDTQNILLNSIIGVNLPYFRQPPTISTFGTGGGTGATVTLIGDGISGRIILQTGTTPVASQSIFSVTFANPLSAKPTIDINIGQINTTVPISTTGLDLFNGLDQIFFVLRASTALVASSTLSFCYSINY